MVGRHSRQVNPWPSISLFFFCFFFSALASFRSISGRTDSNAHYYEHIEVTTQFFVPLQQLVSFNVIGEMCAIWRVHFQKYVSVFFSFLSSFRRQRADKAWKSETEMRQIFRKQKSGPSDVVKISPLLSLRSVYHTQSVHSYSN